MITWALPLKFKIIWHAISKCYSSYSCDEHTLCVYITIYKVQDEESPYSPPAWPQGLLMSHGYEYHYSDTAKSIKPAAAGPLTQDQQVAGLQASSLSGKESLSLRNSCWCCYVRTVTVEWLPLPWVESALQCMLCWCAAWCCASSWGLWHRTLPTTSPQGGAK